MTMGFMQIITVQSMESKYLGSKVFQIIVLIILLKRQISIIRLMIIVYSVYFCQSVATFSLEVYAPVSPHVD